MRPGLVRTIAASGGILLLGPACAAAAAAPGAGINFAPHRAVYEITLERAASGSGVVELVGRMVYELNGSRCEGFTQNMRFVTKMMSQDGSEQVNDLRTSSWEDAAGKRLRFNSEQYRDSKLVESTAGDATRPADGGEIVIDVTKPSKGKFAIPSTNLFPMQHSTHLLEAAAAGQRHFSVGLYDGSEKGSKVYETSAWIGPEAKAPATGGVSGLSNVPAWPVSIAYFEPGSEKRDALPAYELSFQIFANGVSNSMVIDYGEFAVRGELKSLTYFTPTQCGGAQPTPAGVKPLRH